MIIVDIHYKFIFMLVACTWLFWHYLFCRRYCNISARMATFEQHSKLLHDNNAAWWGGARAKKLWCLKTVTVTYVLSLNECDAAAEMRAMALWLLCFYKVSNPLTCGDRLRFISPGIQKLNVPYYTNCVVIRWFFMAHRQRRMYRNFILHWKSILFAK